MFANRQTIFLYHRSKGSKSVSVKQEVLSCIIAIFFTPIKGMKRSADAANITSLLTSTGLSVEIILSHVFPPLQTNQ